MKINKGIIIEGLNQPKVNKKVFTEGKRQNVIVSEAQLDRLLTKLQESKETKINTLIKESYKLIRTAIALWSLPEAIASAVIVIKLPNLVIELASFFRVSLSLIIS